MADGTAIEWTDATWNPITGCSIVSPGCTNCYAMKLAGTRLKHTPSRKGLTLDTKAGPVWNGEVRLNEKWLTQPLKWRRPRRIFVCAHGDLFAENVPDEWIDKVFAVMALAPQHTFQVLTKRAARMRAYLADPSFGIRLGGEIMNGARGHAGAEALVIGITHRLTIERKPLPNVWLGVSAERQKEADERIPDLLATPAAVRFVSAEPMLGPIDFHPYLLGFPAGHPANCACGHGHGFSRCPNYGLVSPACHKCGCRQFQKAHGADGLHWIIVGGESESKGQRVARPMHPDWVRSIVRQCRESGVACFVKQWGAFHPADQCSSAEQLAAHGDMGTALRTGAAVEFEDQWAWRIGKKLAGRLLDGIEHSAFPALTQKEGDDARR